MGQKAPPRMRTEFDRENGGLQNRRMGFESLSLCQKRRDAAEVENHSS